MIEITMVYDEKSRELLLKATGPEGENAVAVGFPSEIDWALRGEPGMRRLRFISEGVNALLRDYHKPKLILPASELDA